MLFDGLRRVNGNIIFRSASIITPRMSNILPGTSRCGASIIIFLLAERRRSPSAHLVRRNGGTHCSDFHFGCSDVPFPVPNRLFLRRIRPHQRPGGSSYFLSERQRSPSAHLVRRKGGTPCWLHFSWLLLAPAHNRFRVVRDLCFTVVEGPLCARLPIYFLIQRQGSGDSAPCALYPGPPCWTEYSSFYGRFSRGRRRKSKNRPKNRIFGLVEPRSAVFRP